MLLLIRDLCDRVMLKQSDLDSRFLSPLRPFLLMDQIEPNITLG
jgi:hypothetical protein